MTEKSTCAVRQEIKKRVKSEDINIKVYDRIDSTNSEAKRYAAASPDKAPVLFVAAEQSAGRGRIGRSFVSRRGRGIYMTLLYFADQPSDAVSVTTAAAVAVALSIEAVTGKKMKIKWVNDIYNERGKVSGILVEGQRVDLGYAVAVGIGINIGEHDFPDEIKDIASSIGDIGGKEGELIARICDHLLDFTRLPSDRAYMKAYRERFMLEGKEVELISVDGTVKHGKVKGVDDDGGLIIETDGGIEAIRSGSVSVREKENF